MDKDQQGTNESQIEHTLSSKQRENTTDKEELSLKSPPNTTTDKEELSLKSPPSSDVIIISDDEDGEATLKKPMLVPPRVNVNAFDELGIVVKGKPETKEHNDNVASRADLYFSSTDLKEKKKEEKKKDDVENVVESSSTSRKGYGHVTLDDLGVKVEDLKNIPWEAFDPTWEMRYDPWLCGCEQQFNNGPYSIDGPTSCNRRSNTEPNKLLKTCKPATQRVVRQHREQFRVGDASTVYQLKLIHHLSRLF